MLGRKPGPERERRLATEVPAVSRAAQAIPEERLGTPACPFPFGNSNKAIFVSSREEVG